MRSHRLPVKKPLAVVLSVLVLAAVLPLLATGLFGRRFLYLRTHLPPDRLAAIASEPGWRLDRLEVAPGVAIAGLQHAPGRSGAPWLVFFGGNHTTLAVAQQFLRRVDAHGAWGLASYAYRGYDASGGTPTQSALESDALAIVDHLRATASIPPDRIVLVGYSLGSGIAADAAVSMAERGSRPGGLVLLAPYTSIAAIFDEKVPLVPVGWLAPDPYRTDALAARIPGPVLIVHGLADRLVPASHGIALASALGSRATLVQLPGVQHQLLRVPEAVEAVREFVRARVR